MPNDWLLELGHTRLKLGCRYDGGVTAIEAIELERFGQWLVAQRPRAEDRFWLAAVPLPAVTARVTGELARFGLVCTNVSTGSAPLPVAASYPGMGVDRWLALQPAWQRLHSPFCLVDCGTATTVDLVDAHGVHLGGWIMPGMDTARQGLLTRAPGLRRPVSDKPIATGPARDTAEAIESGLLLQQVGGIIEAYAVAGSLCKSARAPSLLLTGGAAVPVQSALERRGVPARCAPDLVLQGLAMAVESMRA